MMKNTLTAALVLGTVVASASPARPILVINEDNDHYFKLGSERMTEAALKEYADGICRGPVTHFFMCPQGQRTSYDSKVWEPIWAGLEEPDMDGQTNNVWCVNAKKLFDAGIDSYRVWIGCVREKCVSPWISMRMNDVHFCTISNYFRNTSFYKTHPEFRCVPTATTGNWEQFCMDYSHREVYDYHLAMAKELLEQYDVDGLEMDFLRFTGYFPPGERRSKAHLLTAFIRDVRTFADEVGVRRGRRILLGARVPTLPVVCTSLGMDVGEWARLRLIDWLVVCNQHTCTDYAIPYVEWRDRLHAVNPGLVVLPGCDHKFGINGRNYETMNVALYRGWADALYAQGAPGVYLFNLPYNPQEVRDAVYGGDLAPERIAAAPRHYLFTRHDVLPCGGVQQWTLPLTLNLDRLLSVAIGTPPKAAGEVILVFDADEPKLKDLQVQLNGERPIQPPREIPTETMKWTDGKRIIVFTFAPNAFVPRENAVMIERLPRIKARLVWCEIRLR